MAQSGVGDILKWGLLLGGGYLVYTKFFSGAVTAPSTPPPSTPPPSTPPPSTPPPSGGGGGGGGLVTLPVWMSSLAALASQLQTMSGQSGPLNIDQWVYQYDNLRQQRNMATLTADQVAAILAVNPATKADRTVQISASEFVNDIFGLGYGLSGYRRGVGAVQLPIPRVYVRSW